MSWTDSFNRSSPTRPSRPSRSHYLPPHIRNNHHNTNPFPPNPNSADSDGFLVVPSRGGFRGRSSGRGRGGSNSSQWFQENPIRTRDPKPFKVFEKCSTEVQVSEKEKEGESRGINFDAYEDIPVESTGLDIPPPAVSFAEIDMGPAVNANIRRCKYVRPTPIQRHAIPVALAGRDLMACAQTGSGKTAAFCFPIISGILKNNFAVVPVGVNSGGGGYCRNGAYPVALILSPTRELSCQIYDEARKFSYQTGVKVAVAYGGAPIGLQLRNLEKGVDILVATPGRLVDMIERGKVSLKRIKFLALDEADRMLDMGFEQQIRKIVEQMEMPPPGARQTLLFSATFPTEIQRLAVDFLSNYIFLSVGKVGSSTGLIDQKVELVQDRDKRGRLMSLLRDQRENGSNGERPLTLVFVETKRCADGLENWLCQNHFPATAIHGDKVQMERERALRSFKSGSTPIMVATDVAARGLDVPNVTHVINFDLPKNIDDYVHRIGRTGRAGKCGLATAFFNDKNSPIAKELIDIMQEAKQEVPLWLVEYAESLSTYGSGRANRHGGRKFGGHDFRSASFNENNSYSNSYEGQDAFNRPYLNGSAYYSGPVDTGFSAAGSFDAYAGNAHVYDEFNGESGGWEGESAVGNGWGAESVVASGWE